MSEDKLSVLQQKTQAFVEKQAKALGLGGRHELVVSVFVKEVTAPSVKVEIALQTSRNKKKGYRTSLDRPLTEEDWKQLRALPYNGSLGKVFQYFEKCGNKDALGWDLIKAGILNKHSNPMQQFNLFLKQQGIDCALRKSEHVSGHWADSTYRIFPVW